MSTTEGVTTGLLSKFLSASPGVMKAWDKLSQEDRDFIIEDCDYFIGEAVSRAVDREIDRRRRGIPDEEDE